MNWSELKAACNLERGEDAAIGFRLAILSDDQTPIDTIEFNLDLSNGTAAFRPDRQPTMIGDGKGRKAIVLPLTIPVGTHKTEACLRWNPERNLPEIVIPSDVVGERFIQTPDFWELTPERIADERNRIIEKLKNGETLSDYDAKILQA